MDNSPDTVLVVIDTLTADVVMTPNYVLNESDLGDATVTPVWDFDKPDSVALFRNFQEKCCFVKPTWFDSNYIDMNMSCDATNGWIENENANTLGYAEVGAGTKFTLPARYGTVYRMVTKEALSATTIADSTSTSFRKSVDSMGNQVATLFYNESDNDSIHIVVGEDIKLISISASCWHRSAVKSLLWSIACTVFDESASVMSCVIAVHRPPCFLTSLQILSR